MMRIDLRVFGQFRHCGLCLINGFKDFQCAIIKYATAIGVQLARGRLKSRTPDASPTPVIRLLYTAGGARWSR
ncbi:hypothetical protein VXQ18_08105, partial [Brucella abortus]|nr:hypothetical protein [Brucella abortus]